MSAPWARAVILLAATSQELTGAHGRVISAQATVRGAMGRIARLYAGTDGGQDMVALGGAIYARLDTAVSEINQLITDLDRAAERARQGQL